MLISFLARLFLGGQVGNPKVLFFLFFFILKKTCYILYFVLLTVFPQLAIADSRHTKLNLGFVKVQDLNKILHFEVFIHTDRKL